MAYFLCALLLSALLEWIYRLYVAASSPATDSAPSSWYVYTSELVSYLVKALPALFVGYFINRSGTLIGAVIGATSAALRMILYAIEFPPMIGWPIVAVVLSNISAYAVIGAIAGAAGQLAAERRSNYLSKPTGRGAAQLRR